MIKSVIISIERSDLKIFTTRRTLSDDQNVETSLINIKSNHSFGCLPVLNGKLKSTNNPPFDPKIIKRKDYIRITSVTEDVFGEEILSESFYGLIYEIRAVKEKNGNEYVEFSAVCDFIFFQHHFINFESQIKLSQILEKLSIDTELKSKIEIEDLIDIPIEIIDQISPMMLINHVCFLYNGVIVINSGSEILIQKRESFKKYRMENTKTVNFDETISYSMDI